MKKESSKTDGNNAKKENHVSLFLSVTPDCVVCPTKMTPEEFAAYREELN